MKTHGFILLDVDVVALNNAGKSTSANFDNAIATKKIYKNGKTHVYVSGQAWRYWWRETLQKCFHWNISPIIRNDKVAFTSTNPIIYDDDDIFGYMKAAKEVIKVEGKEKKIDVSVTRISPLKNSAIISVGSVKVAENWSSMSRQHDDSVPYGKEEYSAVMKGMFSLDLDQVGTFSIYNKSGYKNLTDKLKKDALDNGASEINDPFNVDTNGNAKKLIRLNKELRTRRICETISALKVISGGAMQTSNMGDVTPKFIVLATMRTGNHPFGHLAISDGIQNDIVKINLPGLKQVLDDYKNEILGTVYIGKTEGFMNQYNEELCEIMNEYNFVKLTSVTKAIEGYIIEVKQHTV